jgi:hypothetical protein
LVPSQPSPLSSYKSSFAFEASINRSWNGRLWLLRKKGSTFINFWDAIYCLDTLHVIS